MSVRNKRMADGLSKSLQPSLSLDMVSSRCLQVGKEEEDCPENTAGRKFPPVPSRDDTDISIWCACHSLGDRECPLLGVAVLSHPHELTLLTSVLGCNFSSPTDR